MTRPRTVAPHITIAGVIALAMLAVPEVAHAQRLVFIVRHAERADEGGQARQMSAPSDPLLSAAGQARAAKLRTMLADAGISAIYVTEFRRTQDTGLPLAQTLGLTEQRVPSADTAGLVTQLRQRHRDDVVLVIGHSNTVPAIIKALGGPSVTVGDNEYDSLFILVPGPGTLTRIRF